MSEQTRLERIIAARERIAKAMGFKCLSSGGYVELLTIDFANHLETGDDGR